ncbi:hypothetical protein [Pelagicoccus mobilis]|uniref:Uncharacterized protein n=1 Tax=Pelagicoccus mobilis TaxID=415221 RepID=A0A934RUE7_9BACT|nr:hypothetical protein [Pelagicoccus mobilis]MBK1877825.1 hypothetical protein [Pelagicoccus mobilis]
MIASAYPEANRLSYRIRTAITGESTGLETAKLAWQQAEAVKRANADLQRAAQALENGNLLDCLLIESRHPNLLETARSLDHSLSEPWQKRCQTYSWRAPELVDLDSVSKIQSAIEQQGELKEWLFKQYRTAVRSKKETIRAYQIIELIAHTFPEDANAKEEAATKQKQLLEQAAAEVKDAHEQLIPTEKPEDVVRRYRELGLPLAELHNATLANTLATAEADYVKTLFDQAVHVVEEAKDLSESADWQKTEQAYLACDYALAINQARGELPRELRDNFEKVATQLSRIRSKFESSISIRIAIGELRDGLVHKGKPVKLANRVAKLKSLESQATKTGSQIPADLQEEIKAAYTFAKRKRLPLYGGAAAIVVVGLLVSFTLIQKGKERKAAEALQAEALAALQAVEQSSQTSQVQEAIQQWQAEIDKTQPGSELASQAELLNDWIDLQTSLENQYNASIADLNKIATSRDALENEAAIQRLAADIRKTRGELASDLGTTADKQFETTLKNYETLKADALEKDRRAFNRVERELRIAANNANQAKTRAEFLRLQKATQARLVKLNALLKEDYVADRRAELTPYLKSVVQELKATETKWAALDNAWLQLADAKELTPYLDQVERIHSFDILPADQKAALSQTLRLKDDFIKLKDTQSPFTNEETQALFTPEKPYLSASVELTDQETAYLDRLENLDNFANVYQSTVQYFEGSSDPQSEYRIYLVEPISKSDSDPTQSNVTFTFKVRGFDEAGNPEPAPRNIQFISRDDGSFWGFFYKPSTLSPESTYYNHSIVNTLKLLRSGAGRLTLLELLNDLESQSELSPAFRTYWQQQLIGFMELHPWHWGLALSPELKKRVAQLKTLPPADDNQTLWLSTIEQTVPSPEFSVLLDKKIAALAKHEISTLADLYQNAANGNYQLCGFVLADGKPDLFEDVPQDAPLWSVNALTGKIDRVKPGQGLTAYAPILRYATAGGESPEDQLRKASQTSQLELSEPPYQALLPSLYQ